MEFVRVLVCCLFVAFAGLMLSVLVERKLAEVRSENLAWKNERLHWCLQEFEDHDCVLMFCARYAQFLTDDTNTYEGGVRNGRQM